METLEETFPWNSSIELKAFEVVILSSVTPKAEKSATLDFTRMVAGPSVLATGDSVANMLNPARRRTKRIAIVFFMVCSFRKLQGFSASVVTLFLSTLVLYKVSRLMSTGLYYDLYVSL